MTDKRPYVINADDAEERQHLHGERWGGAYKPLTPWMDRKGRRLHVNSSRLPPGRATVPFHYHQREDEAFYILSGRGVLRYGEELTELKAGDCISCPAGTKTGHQIANPFDEDLLYLSIGPSDPDEICVYPDTGKVMVRSLGTVGLLERTEYFHGEPDKPKIFDLLENAGIAGRSTGGEKP